MTVGLFLLSRMTEDTTIVGASVYMLVLGLGLGMVMQVLVIAVQNAVDYRDLGVATSGATLFRLIGGSLGTAVFGAIFAARLDSYLARALPAGAGLGAGLTPQQLVELPAGVRAVYVSGFTDSLSVVFLTALAIAVCAFVLTWLIPERQLRETVATMAGDVGQETEATFPLPKDDESFAKLERALSLRVSRDAKRRYIEEVTTRAGVALSPLAAWLLVRVAADPELELAELSRVYRIDAARVDGAYGELGRAGLVRDRHNGVAGREITAAGRDVLRRLSAARRAYLARLIGEWSPEDRAALVRRLAWVSADGAEDGPPPAG